MKKILFIAIFIASAFSVSAQTGAASLMGSLGYQTEYKRFALSAQGRYNVANAWRIAPDVSFFFPKDKVTGLDINVNVHYVFNLSADRLSFYPLAGFGMQNNFYGKQSVTVNGNTVETDSRSTTDLGINVGAGLTYNLTDRSYLNLEGKFMFGDRDNAVFLLGYGWRF